MDAVKDADSDGSTAIMQILGRRPIYDVIFSCLTPATLARVGSVNRLASLGVKEFRGRAYNVNKRLERFFGKETISFRSLMARTRMVISGSFALQFFDRTFYPESDLDPDRGIYDITTYLTSQGYAYVPSSRQRSNCMEEVEHALATINSDNLSTDEFGESYSFDSACAILTFKRRACKKSLDDSAEKVQVIVTRTCPLATILQFHSTCVMNIITYNAAYSLYPYATFECRDSLAIYTGFDTKEAFAKYAIRGWSIIANPSQLVNFMFAAPGGSPLYSPWFFLDTPRWVCDSMSWSFSLNMEGVVPPPVLSPSTKVLEWDPVAECGWRLSSLPLHNRIRVDFTTIEATVFRWQYTSPDKDHVDSMGDFPERQGTLEEDKMMWAKAGADIYAARTWWDTVLPVFRKQYLANRAAGMYKKPFKQY